MRKSYALLTELGRAVAPYAGAWRTDSGKSRRKEMIQMVRKETCPACKGNRWVTLKDSAGRDIHRKCPQCGGQGFKVRLTR